MLISSIDETPALPVTNTGDRRNTLRRLRSWKSLLKTETRKMIKDGGWMSNRAKLQPSRLHFLLTHIKSSKYLRRTQNNKLFLKIH
jgi:hypothetical protein